MGPKCLQDTMIGRYGSVSLSCLSGVKPLHQWEYVWLRASGHISALPVNAMFWKNEEKFFVSTCLPFFEIRS